ncbi:MAG: hypothetical protein OXG44_06415 [Gammaproteobacteria bacterium]|nr:hypothetical protein [Gammaproteobacteria bacterium]
MIEKLRRILIRQSEQRERINTLAGKDTLTEAETTELTELRTKATETETELREALVEDETDGTRTVETRETDDGETRERRELRSRTRVMDYVNAAITGKPVEGAAEEFAAACECPGMMPVAMLFDRPRREQRAAATVAAAAVAETPMPTAGEVFVSPLAAALGIRMPTVPAGVSAFPYISKGTSPASVAAGDAIGDSSPAISALTAEPGSVAATFTYRMEDAAKLADLDSALTENLREGLADEFDSQVVSGDNTGSNLNGLLKQRAPTAPGDNTVTTFQTFVESVDGFVDGKFAEDFGQVRLVTSPRVSSFLTRLLRSATDPTTALEWLRSTYTGGFRISGQAPTIPQVDHATAGNRRAGGGGLWAIRTRVPSLAYAPIWSGIQLIRDEITGAKKREVTITAYLLAGGVAIVRPDAITTATVKTVQGVAP